MLGNFYTYIPGAVGVFGFDAFAAIITWGVRFRPWTSFFHLALQRPGFGRRYFQMHAVIKGEAPDPRWNFEVGFAAIP